jgi:CheY-like chemotaxis protein
MAAVPQPIEVDVRPVLFVDDEASYLASVEAVADSIGVPVTTAESSEVALVIVKTEEIAAVVCDWKMPGVDGIRFLELVHKCKPGLPLALQTGFALSSYEHMRLDKIGAKWYSKGTNVREIIHKLLVQAEVPIPGVGIEQLIEENNELRALNQRLLADLKASLLQIPNASNAMIHDGFGGGYSVTDLIRDIDQQNSRGLDFVDWWLKARNRLRSMGKNV